MFGERADDELPKLHEEDEDEVGESTIAMAAPSFDLPPGVPSPISEPPPPLPVSPPEGRPPPSQREPLAAPRFPLPPRPSVPPPAAAYEMFGVDAGLAAAARAAVTPSARPFGAPSTPLQLPSLDLSEPFESMDEEESTRAVPRDELLRERGAHMSDEAASEDATLAVAPGDNDTSQLAALAETMAADPNAFPTPPGVFPPPLAAHPGWGEPQPPYVGLSPERSASGPPGPPGPFPEGGPAPGMPGSMGMPTHAMHGQVPGPIPYPGQQGGPMLQGPNASPWAAPGPSGKIKLSSQVVLLAMIGTVCLAIFITGLVLFATTKF